MDADHDWAYRSATYAGLSHRFAFRSDDEKLARSLEVLLAGLREPGSTPGSAAPCGSPGAAPDVWYTLATSARTGPVAGTIDVRRGVELVALDQRPGDALGWVVWDVNRSAAAASGHHLLFHAGALEAGGVGVLLPGPSGSGKSTLVAGLARAGLGYLTDELVALELASGRLLPYAKPVTIKTGSFPVLADMDPGAANGAPPWTGEEWQVPVGADTGRRVGRACLPGLVVLPHYVAGAATMLTPLSHTEAFLALALNAVNLLPHGAAGTAALGALTARCAGYSLTTGDLDEACALVLGLAEQEAACHAH